MTISQTPWTAELVGPLGTSGYLRDRAGNKIAFFRNIKDAEVVARLVSKLLKNKDRDYIELNWTIEIV